MNVPPASPMIRLCVDGSRKVLGFPLVRIMVLGFVLLMMMGLNTDVLAGYTEDLGKRIQHIAALAVAGIAVYFAYGRFIERREVSELSVPGMGRELGIGMLVGVGLYTCCVLVLLALGMARFEGINSWTFMLPAVAMALSSGVFEELLFRGVLFRSVEEWFGSWAALVVSSLVFGLTHLMNPQGTMEGALFIAVEAGILLAAAYLVTRRLWLSMGFHVAWNFTQSGIFSGIVSGNAPSQGLIQTRIEGPELLTGGSFGVESSVIALVLCTSVGVAMAVIAARRGLIVPPCWKRKPGGSGAV